MWVAEKISVSVGKSVIMFGEKSGKRTKRISLCPNVITPDTIPEFFIPPQIQPLQMKAKPLDTGRAAPSIRVSPCDDGGSPKPREHPAIPIRPHIIQVESVEEESPRDGDVCSDGEETTNADPHSQAALSLPHVARAQTCYGFCTLLESPHTRRKESLFHAEPMLLLPRCRSNTYSQRTSPRVSPSSSPSSFSLNALATRLSPRSYALSRQSALDSDTASSNESSPFGSPLLNRSPPAAAKSSVFKTLSQERLLTRNPRRGPTSRNNSLSTDEGSSTDNSPNVMRRLSEDTTEALSSGCTLVPPALFPSDLTLSRERAMRESAVPLGKNGSLRLSAEYSAGSRRLWLRLISAEGLYAAGVDTKSINCSVSLSLVPGKLQKQRSTVIRKSRNPIFNEDFFFDGLTVEDLCLHSLRFKVVNKKSTMKRDYILADCDLPLSSFGTF